MIIAKLKVYSARLVLRRKYGKPVIQRINAHGYRGWSAKLSKNFHVINMGLQSRILSSRRC
jgi:fibrillarin-like rRNA methylase